MTSSIKTLNSIQVLRAIAAMLVVVHHALMALRDYGLSAGAGSVLLPNSIVEFGASGVDIFFVISGFIMVHVARDVKGSPANAKQFLINRVIRIVPLYWIISIVCIILFSRRHEGGLLDPGYLLSSFLFIPMANPISERIHPILDQGWTLNYEMGFYLLFALTLIRPLPFWPLPLGVLFLAIFTACNFIPGYDAAVFWSNPIIFEFLFGVIIGYAFKAGLKLTYWPTLILLGISLGAFAFSATTSASIDHRLWVWGLPSACVAIALLETERLTGLFNTRPARVLARVGNASYSIYLTHGFATMSLAIALRHGWMPVNTAVEFVAAIGVILIAIGIGLLTYEWIENPLLRATKRWATTFGLSK